MTVPLLDQAHEGDAHAERFAPHTFAPYPPDPSGYARDPYAHCTYCGSISIDDMLTLMQTPGVEWSASDYKYGWPHKFYVTVPCEPIALRTMRDATGQPMPTQTLTAHTLKFYTTHLRDATLEQLDTWNGAIARLTGVRFERDGETLRYVAERGAERRYGRIG